MSAARWDAPAAAGGSHTAARSAVAAGRPSRMRARGRRQRTLRSALCCAVRRSCSSRQQQRARPARHGGTTKYAVRGHCASPASSPLPLQSGRPSSDPHWTDTCPPVPLREAESSSNLPLVRECNWIDRSGWDDGAVGWRVRRQQSRIKSPSMDSVWTRARCLRNQPTRAQLHRTHPHDHCREDKQRIRWIHHLDGMATRSSQDGRIQQLSQIITPYAGC